MSGFGTPPAKRHADADAGEEHAVVRRDLALFREVGDRSAGHHHVHDFAIDDALRDLGRRRKNQGNFVSGGPFERASELGQHVVHRSACQNLDFAGVGMSRCGQCNGETDRERKP
jgi:hypothetical protein